MTRSSGSRSERCSLAWRSVFQAADSVFVDLTSEGAASAAALTRPYVRLSKWLSATTGSAGNCRAQGSAHAWEGSEQHQLQNKINEINNL